MADRLPCPICRKPVPIAVAERPSTFPFCGERCRLIDLGRWADGAYVVPGRPVVGDGAETDAP